MKTSKAKIALAIFGFATPFLIGDLSVFAQSDEAINNNEPPVVLSESQILNAKPYKNPLKAPNTSSVTPSKGSKGTPGVKVKAGSKEVESKAFGSFGVPFTSARVSHLPTTAVVSTSGGYLSATFPYRVIGRLNFNVGFCSASLIRRSVIVTAAHCIQNFGSGSNTFTGFTFLPAFYNGATPYGSWPWLSLVRPASWANGTDIGSGSARDNDLAVIALGKNGNNQFIGDITGYLNYGWNNYSFVSSSRTGNLAVAALSTLGYPGLLDVGRILQRTDGPSYLTTISGAGQIYQGSNFTGGSSGGPWLANLKYQNPSFSGGANGGTSSVSNVIVGVTSWGAADPNAPKDNWSSQFRQNTRYPNASYGVYGAGNIASLLNTLCSSTLGGQTLASLGYCN